MSAVETGTNSTTEAETVLGEEPRDESACTACKHAWPDHDALGRRFCTATRELGWSRGCICR